jgi:Zn-dependent peptidase ImmA (M78 family)
MLVEWSQHRRQAMSEGPTREEVHDAVDRAVLELLEAASISQPPVDAISLAQGHLGMVICLDRTQSQRGRAQRVAGKRQIFLRPEPSEERHQWTVAHEVGEHHKAELLRRLGIDPEQTRAMLGESLANLFADRLLVPTPWLAGEARDCGFDLLALKGRFRTASHEVIAWRLLDLPEPCVITVVDNGHVHRRRSNAWRVNKELSEPERRCQGLVHADSRPHELREGGWQVQGWPIHQADWKREVLRSVLEEM